LNFLYNVSMAKYFKTASVVLVSAYFWYYAQTYTEWHFIDNVNLIFHEAGHTIFFWTGDFLSIAAGSMFQFLLPLFIAFYFYINRQQVSAAICFMWAGQNLLNISVYAGDAIVMQLPLLGGNSVTHDWNYLLSITNMINHTQEIAAALYTLGIIMIITGIAFAVYTVWTTSANKETRQII
jgi:hypothetical protein